jgi:hypothetical protein
VINDLPDSTSFLTSLYADDTTLIMESETLTDLYNKTNNELEKVADWVFANKLMLHPEKTRYLIYSNKKPEPKHKLYIAGKEITIVHENGKETAFKLVGIMIDENLNWKHHIGFIQKKLLKVFGKIITSKHCLPLKIKVLLYNALFKSHIEFCNIIWGGANESFIKPIEILQKKMIRLINNANYNACSHRSSFCKIRTT